MEKIKNIPNKKNAKQHNFLVFKVCKILVNLFMAVLDKQIDTRSVLNSSMISETDTKIHSGPPLKFRP